MKKIIFMLIIAFVAGYGVLNYHYILLDDSLKIIKKTGMRYENTFVDARGTKKVDILLKRDLLEAGIKDVLKQVDTTLQESK